VGTQRTQWTTELDARYELLDEAGRGGMGVVFKARDRETGEVVALKVLRPDIAEDRVAAERFLNEVRLSRRITHKNVTRVYEFTRAGSTAYLSMEFVDGESLRAIVERMGAVNPRKGIQIARQICAALHEAHAQGIVHRDLKPENVMIDRAGNVKVMDFGIARLLDTSVTMTAGGILGTPAYMAPEQAEGKAVDARTDIYATGLILYEIFTGKAAFSGDTPMVVALKQIRETPPAPRSLDPALPWELEATIMRCLEKDPAARFQSVEELDAALFAVPIGSATTGTLRPGNETAGTTAGGEGAAETGWASTSRESWPAVAHTRTTPLAQQTQPGERPPAAHAETPHATRVTKLPRRRLLAAAALILALVTVFRERRDDPIPYERFTLDNGLKVLLIEDHSAPTVAVSVTYNVGAKDDPPGREGLAHLFEHMLFNGSLNVGKGEHHLLVTSQGGTPNGQTFMDHTQVWETLPANQLELALFLEADRMRSLRLDQARLDTERGTVLAERQQRVENAPYGRAMDALFDLTYDIRPYKKTHIGTEEGLRAITLQEVNDFFRIFYAPNNAVLAISGAFEPDHARALVEKYFEHIPAQPPAPEIDLAEPAQTAERRGRIEDPFAPGPRTYLAYKIPPGGSDDVAPLVVLTSMLGESAGSRLHQRLVRETEMVNGVAAQLEPRKGPGLLTFVLVPAAGRDEAAVQKVFDDAIAQLLAEGAQTDEVQRAKARLELTRATGLQQAVQRAGLLGEYEFRFGGADRANDRLRRFEKVSAADVTRVAREYLRPERRSILTVVPGGGSATPAFKTVTTPATQPVSSVERLNRAPISRELLRVSLPEAPETRLDNGLSVLIAEETRTPLVSVRMEFRGAGTRYVPVDDPALAITTAAMMREGTTTRSSRQMAQELDALGATVTWGETVDSGASYLQVTGLRDTFDRWFPLLADLVLNPSFPSDELNLLKRRFTAEWQQRLSAPFTVATEHFNLAVYGPVAGRRIPTDAFSSLTSDRLRAWHKERYAPENTILVLAGDVGRDEALETVRRSFGGWSRTGIGEPVVPVHLPDRARVLIVNRPGSVQTTIMAGVAGPGNADPDHLALAVANRVLGGGAASRLFTKMRDERGLTFAAYSLLTTQKDRGDWRAYSDITSSRLEEGVGTLLGELERIGREPIPAEELDQAKHAIVASFAVTLEQLQAVVNYIAARRSGELSADYWDRYPEKLMTVTPADAQRVAARYMDLSRLQVIAIGDAAQIEPLLKPLGEVTVVR
jgi:zinc protease